MKNKKYCACGCTNVLGKKAKNGLNPNCSYKFCECGCGKQIGSRARFSRGHQWRDPATRKFMSKRISEEYNYGIPRHTTAHTEQARNQISKSRKGKCAAKENPNWKGGQYTDALGYVWIRVDPSKPGQQAYKQRSRLAIEKRLGRELTSAEIVHHVNENKSDDRPSNLQIMSRAEHMKVHKLPGHNRKS